MASQIEQSLSSNQGIELRRLRKTRSRRLLHILLFCFFIILVGYHFKKSVFVGDTNVFDVENLRSEFSLAKSNWAQKFNNEQLSMQSWLERRGTSIELELFNKISGFIYISAAKSFDSSSDDMSIFPALYLSVHRGVLRVAFILIACFRLWLLVILYSAYRGYKTNLVYKGDDMLGQTGNSRLFYSGIRAGLENLCSNGAPNKQVRGLACPKLVSDAILKGSKLYKLLEKYSLANKTNSTLAAIILEYKNHPAYVANLNDTKSLSSFIEAENLSANTLIILEKILELHSFYADGQIDSEFLSYLDDFSELNDQSRKYSVSEYAVLLQKSMHRILTPEMREMISNIPIGHICTMVLAIEAGKVMLFSYEGERWLRKSNYPQLCARAILHSVSAFAEEHDFLERTLIRQAIIYSSRSGDFGPVKLPADMNEYSRAMRQWAEILIINPHEINNASNEIEMYGIVYEAHKKFKSHLLNKIMTGDKETMQGTYATMGNLFLVPFKTIHHLTRKSLSDKMLKRLDELSNLISKRQQQKIIHSDNLVDVAQKNIIPANTKVFEPFTEDEIKSLSDTFSIPVAALREWSSLRIILNNFGWLARRVGDYSVQESSLIFAVMKCDSVTPGANSLNLIGVPSMVPLRASQLDERWGKTWHSRTFEVVSSTMAENKEDFDKLMRGESLHEFEESTQEAI